MVTTMTSLMDDLYHRIEHGEPAYREWLRGQLASFAAEHEGQWVEFDPARDVDNLVRKFAWNYDGAPRRLPADLADARREVLQEELGEYLTAAAQAHDAVEEGRDPGAHLASCLDALVDLVVVSMVTAAQHGFDFRQAWRRVHEANMAKELATPERPSTRGRTSLDLVKPDGWRPPQHLDLVTPNAHWCPPCPEVEP